MDLLNPDFEDYLNHHTDQEPELLRELNRQTHLKVLLPRMLSGHYQGRFLSMLSQMIKPKHVLEIGTYTGYSAICLAEGIQEGGSLDSIDKNEELEDFAQTFIDKANLSNIIKLHVGNALEIIPTLTKTYDLVFIDADKSNYLNYLDLVVGMLNPGGYIIADNVLWSGKVLDDNELATDRDTQIIDEFNKRIQNHKQLSNVLLPIRDGLMIARKI